MRRSFLTRLADRLILCPTTHPIPAEGKSRRHVPFGDGHLEIWTHRVGDPEAQVDMFFLKFPGTAGRAERSTDGPACFLPNIAAELWSVNPPGYGGSTGPASVQRMPAMAAAAFDALARHAHQSPIVVVGNSLGGLSALYLAAVRPVDALVVRNPPPLRELILGRHGWWTLGLGARLIARQVPEELCPVANARRATAPLVFVTSAKDRLVPPRYQQPLFDAYAGEKQRLTLDEADHATPMTEEEIGRYRKLLEWLGRKAQAHRIGAGQPPRSGNST